MAFLDRVGLAGTTDAENLARRNALLLSARRRLAEPLHPIAISMGGLAGFYLLGADKSLATAPVTGFNLGVAIGALPAAWLMRQIGRRYGFLSGMVMTALGGIISAIALFRHDFWLFAIGMIFIGLGGSFVQQYRFAAADGSPTNFKAQAISWVLAGGVFAAIIGPQTVIFTRELFDPVMFAGSFVALVPLALITMSILWFLRIPNDTKPGDVGHDETPARPLLEIISQSRFITAMICGVGSYALMTFMMTGAPLAMVGCGFSPELATLGIQWHVMAMFAPSFFTGKLIARFGRDTITATGLVILLGCAIVAHMGIELWNFWLALVLLGVGWNFGFIGATTMVTMTYRPSEKNKVQGFHDVTLFGIVAFSSLMSGKVLNAWGWDALNSLFWPVALFCLLALGTQVLLGAPPLDLNGLRRDAAGPRFLAGADPEQPFWQRFPMLIGRALAITPYAPLTAPHLCRNHPPRCGRVPGRVVRAAFAAQYLAGGRIPAKLEGYQHDNSFCCDRLRIAFRCLRHLGDQVGDGRRPGQRTHAGNRRLHS
jgi:predicted MFS family arabinose efflux permease